MAAVGYGAEIGIRPVLCASGGTSGKLEQAIAAALEGLAHGGIGRGEHVLERLALAGGVAASAAQASR